MEELFSKDEYYKRVDVESAKFINSMTNLEIEIKGKEPINMCKAFMEQKELGIKEGMILGIEQGRAEGLETGRQEGLETGIQRGRAEGATQREKEIIRNLYSNHIDIETIMRVTSLTEEEVKKILIS